MAASIKHATAGTGIYALCSCVQGLPVKGMLAGCAWHRLRVSWNRPCRCRRYADITNIVYPYVYDWSLPRIGLVEQVQVVMVRSLPNVTSVECRV